MAAAFWLVTSGLLEVATADQYNPSDGLSLSNSFYRKNVFRETHRLQIRCIGIIHSMCRSSFSLLLQTSLANSDLTTGFAQTTAIRPCPDGFALLLQRQVPQIPGTCSEKDYEFEQNTSMNTKACRILILEQSQ